MPLQMICLQSVAQLEKLYWKIYLINCCDVNGNTIVCHMTKEKISFLCFLCLVYIENSRGTVSMF